MGVDLAALTFRTRALAALRRALGFAEVAEAAEAEAAQEGVADTEEEEIDAEADEAELVDDADETLCSTTVGGLAAIGICACAAATAGVVGVGRCERRFSASRSRSLSSRRVRGAVSAAVTRRHVPEPSPRVHVWRGGGRD